MLTANYLIVSSDRYKPQREKGYNCQVQILRLLFLFSIRQLSEISLSDFCFASLFLGKSNLAVLLGRMRVRNPKKKFSEAIMPQGYSIEEDLGRGN